METKINIAAILKDKPKRTKLYTDTFGELSIEDIDAEDELGITLSSKDDDELLFYNDGRYNLYGEPILVPSKSMRDWRKFSWKKGDVLQHSEYPLTVIFESFEDDTYTSFKCKYSFDLESVSKWLVSNSQCSTKHFYKVSEEEAKEFIEKVELNFNGKLNMETLQIEEPEFKDGDIVICNNDTIVLVKEIGSCREVYFHAYIFCGKLFIQDGSSYYGFANDIKRIATEEEKQKDGKAWDAEKKEIVYLKPKVVFKPFDKVLVRDYDNEVWRANLFSNYTSDDSYGCVCGAYNQCIPYNEETAKLIGTTNNVEG